IRETSRSGLKGNREGGRRAAFLICLSKEKSMKKILMPVDGSECALRAVKQVSGVIPSLGAASLHPLNVQPPLPPDVMRVISAEAIKGFHHDEAKKDLQTARAPLDAAGAKYEVHIVVAGPAQSIARLAHGNGCDQVVMGTHGPTGLAAVVTGSGAT